MNFEAFSTCSHEIAIFVLKNSRDYGLLTEFVILDVGSPESEGLVTPLD